MTRARPPSPSTGASPREPPWEGADDTGDRKVTTVIERDRFGRQVLVTDPGGHSTRWTYDARDNVVSTTVGIHEDDLAGQTTRYDYDALDRPTLELGPMGELVAMTYDVESNLETYTDALDNITRYTYDQWGRVERVDRPGLDADTTTTYNEASLIATVDTPRGHRFVFTYDEEDHLTRRDVYLLPEEEDPIATDTWGYDIVGRLTSAGNATADVLREYNSFAQVTREEVSIKGLPAELKRDHVRTYRPALDPDTATTQTGRALGYTVDPLGRFDTLTVDGTTAVDYDWLGPDRLQTKTTGSGPGAIVASYGYDPERMLASVRRQSGAQLDDVVHLDYAWTARHEIARETDQLREGSEHRYGYDDAGRLVRFAQAVPRGKAVAEALRRIDYDLDAARNMTARKEYLGRFPSRTEADVGDGHRYDRFAGKPLAYDGEGNLTDDGDGRTATYDHDNRLTTVTANGDTVSYGYGPFGRKLTRTSAATSETRISWYDGWELVAETDPTGDTVHYEAVHGQQTDEPLSYWHEGTEYRLVQDRSGSVIAVADTSGRVLERYEYIDSYGRFLRHGAETLDHVRLDDAGVLRLRFTGEVSLASAQLADRLAFTPPVDGTWSTSPDGHELHFTSTDWPGGDVTLTISADIRSVFAVPMDFEGDSERTVTIDSDDLSERVLHDWIAPEVVQVAHEPGGPLVVRFSEPVSPTDLDTAFELEAAAVPGLIPYEAVIDTADPHTVRVTPGETPTIGAGYTLRLLAAKVQDLDGTTAGAGEWSWTEPDTEFTVDAGYLRIWDRETQRLEDVRRDPSLLTEVGNRLFFQAREMDPVTGLYDFRRRWYDPHLGRFLNRDPEGYVDGPNTYAAFVANPANFSDPFGTSVGGRAAGRSGIGGGGELTFRQKLDNVGEFSIGVYNGYTGARDEFRKSVVDFLSHPVESSKKAREGLKNAWDDRAQLPAAFAAGVTGSIEALISAEPGEAGEMAGRVLFDTVLNAIGAGVVAKAGKIGRLVPDRKNRPRAKKSPSAKSDDVADAIGESRAPAKQRRGGGGDGNGSGGAGCPIGNSFVAGTPVLTPDGGQPIDQLEAGDLVLAWDAESGAVVERRILGTTSHEKGELVVLTIDGAELRTTVEHPFWVVGRGWTPAAELVTGDALVDPAGEIQLVEAVDFAYGRFEVFNFEVEGAHNYFVGAGWTLVHNAKKCPTPSGGSDTPGLLPHPNDRPDFPGGHRGRYQAAAHHESIDRLPEDFDVHHSIPQELRNDPRVDGIDLDHPENLRGVRGSRTEPAGPKRNVHQHVSNAWDDFLRLNPGATRDEILGFRDFVDYKFGFAFWENQQRVLR